MDHEKKLAAANDQCEDPFILIEKGNSLELSQNQWGSSNYYSKAYSALLKEYHTRTLSNTTNAVDNDDMSASEKKMAALYHDQSVEYLNRSRKSLIKALMFEQEEDMKRWSEQDTMVEIVTNCASASAAKSFKPIMSMLTPELMERRIDTFSRLFVSPIGKYAQVQKEQNEPMVHDLLNYNKILEKKESNDLNEEVESESETGIQDIENEIFENTNPLKEDDVRLDEGSKDDNEEDEDGVSSLEDRLAKLVPGNDPLDASNEGNDNQRLTLEQRLADLDSSIPNIAIMKSDVERLENIKSGLDSLGVYIPSEKKNTDTLDDQSTSEEEQMQLIMSMAKDAVELEKRLSGDNDSDMAVEDILKKSGIRIDMPSEENYDKDLMEILHLQPSAYANPPTDITLSSFHLLTQPSDVKQDDENSHNISTDLQSLRNSLAKSQQMLLQATICISELEDMNDESNSTKSQIMDNCKKNELKKQKQSDGVDDLDKNSVSTAENQSNNDDDKEESVTSDVDEVSQNDEKDRIRNLGKESLLKAQAYIETLINAWPES